MRSKKTDGNALAMILIAIVVLALLTALVSRSSDQQSDTLSRQTMDDEISRMLAQTSALGGALGQMIVNGEDAATLYSTLSLLKPGDAGFETAPHNLKIYHPLGGGINYMSGSTSSAAAVATGFNINSGSIVTGVGATDAVTGDILFTAKISSASYCQRINTIVTGSAAVPTLVTANFNTLFTAGTAVTIGANCAPTCANIARQCVSNVEATAWGFYSALLPG